MVVLVVVLLILIVAIPIWFVVSIWRAGDGADEEGPAGGSHTESEIADQIEWRDALDLRQLPSTRYRVRGTAYLIPYETRLSMRVGRFALLREPENAHDESAIAIYSGRVKVGYVSAKKAASLASLLDQLPYDLFEVGGASVEGTSIQLWVDLPNLPDLRTFVKSRKAPPGQ